MGDTIISNYKELKQATKDYKKSLKGKGDNPSTYKDEEFKQRYNGGNKNLFNIYIETVNKRKSDKKGSGIKDLEQKFFHILKEEYNELKLKDNEWRNLKNKIVIEDINSYITKDPNRENQEILCGLGNYILSEKFEKGVKDFSNKYVVRNFLKKYKDLTPKAREVVDKNIETALSTLDEYSKKSQGYKGSKASKAWTGTFAAMTLMGLAIGNVPMASGSLAVTLMGFHGKKSNVKNAANHEVYKLFKQIQKETQKANKK